MAGFDPYRVLGVSRKADNKTIEKAYKAQARTAHPDVAGGDEERFQALNRAKMILLDPIRREKYDTTGEIDETSHENDVMAPVGILDTILSGMVMQFVTGQGGNPNSVDLVFQIREGVKAHTVEIKKARKQTEHAIEVFEKMAKRLKPKKGVPEDKVFLLKVIAFKIDTLRRSIPGIDKQIEVLDRARVMIDDYIFEREASAAMNVYNPWHS